MTKIKILHFLIGILIGLMLTPFIGAYSTVAAMVCGTISWTRYLSVGGVRVEFSEVAFTLYGSVIGYALAEWILTLV